MAGVTAGDERWNGSAWIRQKIPSPSAESPLSAVSCASARTCTAVGGLFRRRKGGVELTLAERWNGRKWAIQRTVNPRADRDSFFSAVSCASRRACVAVGATWVLVQHGGIRSEVEVQLAERWNGRKWMVMLIGKARGSTDAFLDGVSCASARSCEAVGGYGPPGGGHTLMLAEHWNGTRWARQRVPAPAGGGSDQLLAVSCTSAAACTAVGYSAGPLGMLAERWNGTAWVSQPVPGPSGATTLQAVSCTTAESCTAVGSWSTGGVNPALLAERWNGSEWASQPIPSPVVPGAAEITAYLAGLSCASSTACAAVGFYYSDSDQRTLAERYS